MRAYINIFLTLVMPLSFLFAVVATIYFSLDYDFNKAIRLGVLSGVLSSVSLSLILAFIILIVRVIRRQQFMRKVKSNQYVKKAMPVQNHTTNPTAQVQNPPRKEDHKFDNTTATMVETFMLLMDTKLAYEVSLSAIDDKKIADVFDEDEKEKSIHLRTVDEEIHIKVSPLTKHTAQVLISSTLNKDNIRKIITVLKEKEHSFMQY